MKAIFSKLLLTGLLTFWGSEAFADPGALSLPAGLRIETRLPSQVLLPLVSFEQKLEFSVPKGEVSEPTLRFHLERLSWSGRTLRVGQLRLELSAQKWTYRESLWLRLECRQPLVSLVRKDWDLELPEKLSLRLRLLPGGGAEWIESPWPAFRETLERSLRDLTRAETLARDFRFNGDCPGSTASLLESFLRNRLTDSYAKDPQLWAQGLAEIEKVARPALEEGLVQALASWKAPRALDLDLRVERAQSGALSLLTEGAGAAVPPDLVALRSALRVTATPDFLESLVRPLVEAKSPRYDVESSFAAEDLAPLFSELFGRPPREKVELSVGLVQCPEAQPVRIRPWISRDAERVGVDFEAGLLLEIRTEGGYEIKRGLPLRAVFEAKGERFASEQSRWAFSQANWQPKERVCGLANVNELLGGGLQWLLASPALKDFLSKEFGPSLEAVSVSTRRPRVLGRADYERRRVGGGFYADALVFESHRP